MRAEREQLVDSVERLALDAGSRVYLARGHERVGDLIHPLGAVIAVGNRVANECTRLIEQGKVDCPRVDADRGGNDAGLLTCRFEALDHLRKKLFDIPAVVSVHALLGVIEAVYLPQVHEAVVQPPHEHAPARCTDIDRRIRLSRDVQHRRHSLLHTSPFLSPDPLRLSRASCLARCKC